MYEAHPNSAAPERIGTTTGPATRIHNMHSIAEIEEDGEVSDQIESYADELRRYVSISRSHGSEERTTRASTLTGATDSQISIHSYLTASEQSYDSRTALLSSVLKATPRGFWRRMKSGRGAADAMSPQYDDRYPDNVSPGEAQAIVDKVLLSLALMEDALVQVSAQKNIKEISELLKVYQVCNIV